MSNAILAFVAGAGNGYLQQSAIEEKRAEERKLKERNAQAQAAPEHATAIGFQPSGSTGTGLSAPPIDQATAGTSWTQDLGQAMRGGHDAMAQLASNINTGPLANTQFTTLPSEDGKQVRYAQLGDNGQTSPVPHLPAFSNDPTGVTQAGWHLNQLMSPDAITAHYGAQAKQPPAASTGPQPQMPQRNVYFRY